MIRRILKVKNKLFRRSHKASSTSNPAPSFVYEPLEPGQIRVLQLAAGKKGDALSGELLITSIDEESFEYDALSYMWGDPAPTNTIHVSGKALSIASNLNTALHYLRHISRPLIIWIDAVCINQEDEIERAEQVQLMRHVYSRASTVRIWIDDPDIDGDSPAVEALKVIHVALDDFDWLNSENLEARYKETLCLCMGEDPYFWAPVIPILTNEYWSRAWIQQEVANASHLILHCMDISIPGAAIGWFYRAAWRRYSSSSHCATLWDTAWNQELRSIARIYSPAIDSIMLSTRPGYLCDLLGHNLHVTLPQDRVYALMHLAQDYEDGGIAVDYSHSGIDVLVEAAAYHVQVHRNLRFLKNTFLRVESNEDNNEDSIEDSYEGQDENVPTWIARSWLCDDTHLNVGDWPETTVTSCLAKSISKADRRLHMRAMRVDHVRSCLTRGLTSGTLTTSEIWNSSLGSYLRNFAGPGAEHLPPTASEVLFKISESELKEYIKLVEVYSKARGDRTFQSLLLDWHEDDKDRIFATLREASSSALSVLLQLSQDPLRGNQDIFQDCVVETELLEGIDPVTMATIHQLLWRLYCALFIDTRTKGLGRVANCAIDDGDEIWIALGCDMPIVLRPQSNGRYWFVCAADIPEIRDDENLKQFTSDVQPGDKIGEWIVEDIEIE